MFMQETPEINEQLQQENKQIFNAIVGFVHLKEYDKWRLRYNPDELPISTHPHIMKHYLGPFSHERPEHYEGQIFLDVYYTPEAFIKDLEVKEIPSYLSQFNFPIASFDSSPPYDESDENKPYFGDPVTTPYGVLPNSVIGPDNKVYSFRNRYFFDSEGKAKKIESIVQYDTTVDKWAEENFRDQSPNMLKRVMRIDFTPKEGDTRATNLAMGDYEMIHSQLRQIEKGEIVYEP